MTLTDNMSRFKRLVLLVIVCFASYVVLVLRVHEMLSANQKSTTNHVIPLLEYHTTPSMSETDRKTGGRGPELSRFHENYLQEDTTLDNMHFFEQNDKHTGDLVPNSPPHTLKFQKLKKHNAVKIRDVSDSSGMDHFRQRAVTFVRAGDIHVYGAYLDMRQKGNVTVRILALKHNTNHDSLVCYVSDRGKRLVLYAQAYRMCENHGKVFEGWIYSCVLPKSLKTLPHQISVAPLSQRQTRNKRLTTLNLKTIPSQTNHSTAEEKIGVCVPPLFGNLSLSAIINFIQMCKVLGADKVFMYIGKVSSEIKKFLEFHSQSDISLSVIDWNLPENVSESEDKIWYHGQLLAVQDCLYHNMASFHFLLFIDLDEMLVPQDTHNWPEMLTKIFESENRATTAALSFKSAFFDPARVPEDSENILYFQHLHRTRAVSKVRNKLFVQPLKVFELGIHHLSKALSEDFKSVSVSEKIVLLHHYHMCVKVYEPQMKCYPTKKDKRILRYKEKLTHLSHRIITDASKLFA